MLIAILAVLLLADSAQFVRFDRCYLDTSVWPAQFRPYKVGDTKILRDEQIFIRADAVLFIAQPEAHIAGIPCVRISTAHGSAFVQGSTEDIERKVMEAR